MRNNIASTYFSVCSGSCSEIGPKENFRPFLHARPHLWDLSTDRYLHFPVSAQPKNNHYRWVQNVNSESEDSDEEWVKVVLKDMIDEEKDESTDRNTGRTESKTKNLLRFF